MTLSGSNNLLMLTDLRTTMKRDIDVNSQKLWILWVTKTHAQRFLYYIIANKRFVSPVTITIIMNRIRI